jgi:hypothetical protein
LTFLTKSNTILDGESKMLTLNELLKPAENPADFPALMCALGILIGGILAIGVPLSLYYL